MCDREATIVLPDGGTPFFCSNECAARKACTSAAGPPRWSDVVGSEESKKAKEVN